MVPVPGGLNRYKFILSSQQYLKLNMMNSYAEKTVEQSKTIADNGTKSSFINNRPEALTMQNLKDSANNSAQVQQLKAYQTMADQAIIQRQANTTGMPDNLKSGIENLSGYSMSDVKVHYNSDKPAQLNAHAYAQGTQIHLASGQEKHLPHEAWHVVQQKQGRVKPTMQLKGKVAINDDAGLENEADVMGAKALTTGVVSNETSLITNSSNVSQTKLIQCYTYGAGTTRKVTVQGVNDKNIFPGTPAENSHHLHQAEKEFDKCFNGSDKAINDCKYECTVTPKYGTNVDVTGGDKDYGDPTISVDITDNGVKVNHPVDDGVDGLTFKDAS